MITGEGMVCKLSLGGHIPHRLIVQDLKLELWNPNIIVLKILDATETNITGTIFVWVIIYKLFVLSFAHDLEFYSIFLFDFIVLD